MKLLRRMRRAGDEHGVALVTVIGVAAVFAIVSVTVVSTALFASTTSTVSRAGVQVQAAAEQGIDLTLAFLRTNAYRGNEASFPCTLTHSVSTPNGAVTMDVEIDYLSEGAAAATCPVASGVDLTGATFTSRASMTTLSGDGPVEVKKVVQEELSLIDPVLTPPLFGYGVFSAGDFTTTNNFEIIDGGAHTNGKFECNSSAQILGPVSAVLGASITNVCTMEGLWTGGNFTCTTDSLIDGDLIVTGTANFTNRCAVTGNALIGGKITSGGWGVAPGRTYSVEGNITSASSTMELADTSRIGGNAQAAGVITRNGTAYPLSTIVAGSRTPNTPSAVPAAPPVQTMPAITYANIVSPTAPAPTPFKAWVQQNAIANGAPTWSDAYAGTTCTAAKANYSINGGLTGPAVSTVLDARTCDVVLQGNSASDPLELVLNEDLTIIAKTLTSTNGLHVSSNKVGTPAKLRIIVPLPTGGTVCSGAGAGAIKFMAGGVVFDSDVETFLYTNGLVSLTNGVDMHGSVYGCTTSFSVNSTITYVDMTPPGMATPPSPIYEFEPSARYDLGAND